MFIFNKQNFALEQLHTICSFAFVFKNLVFIVTARIRRMTGGYVFTGVCLSNFRRGDTPSSWGGGGSTPTQFQTEGYPIRGPDVGVTPSQVQMGGGNPFFTTPLQDWMGSTLPSARLGTPLPPHPLVRRQSSIASTCYAAGGMPLVFTQEHFLVPLNVCRLHDNMFFQPNTD